MRAFAFILLLAALAVPVLAQSAGKTEVFPAREVERQETSLAAQAATAGGGSSATLADYGSHKVQISVRTASGGAEIHAHFDDIMIVQKGTATLITGGSLVDAKNNPDGETKGTSIQGGKSQTVSPGDIVTVNAGIPHQLLIAPGTTYSALVIKVRE